MKLLQLSLLIIIVMIMNCKDSNKLEADITKLYPLEDGTVWNYLLIENGGTFESSNEFKISQLSEDSKRAVLGLDYGFSIPIPFILEAKNSGICIDLYEDFWEVTFEEVVANIDSIENEQCAAFLDLETSMGDSYEFNYFTSGRNYTYEVQVSQTELIIDGKSYQTKVFEIPAGRNKNGKDIISEVYFNPELGIVKLVLEHEKGTNPDEYMILQSMTN